MLALPMSAAWLSVACDLAAFAQPHKANNKPAPPKLLWMSTDEIFIEASFSRAFEQYSRGLRVSRDHRNAKIEWIDGNGHGVACAIVERLGPKIRRALKRHALRKIRKIWLVVRAKNPAKLVPQRKQIIVVSQIWQELLRRLIRWNGGEHPVLRRGEGIVRLHQVRDTAPAVQLLIQKSHHAVARNGQ